MRRVLSLGAFMLVTFLFTGAARPIVAQQAGGQPSPALRILARYTLTSSALPAGLQLSGTRVLSNAILAGDNEDPQQARAIVERGRLDGLEQDFSLSGNADVALSLDLALFRDSSGAQADLTDLTAPPEFSVSEIPAPALGDANEGIRQTIMASDTLQLEILQFGFTIGRLEVSVAEVGPIGSPSEADITPLLTIMADSVRSQPVPAPTESELSILSSQASPESILHDAYRFLLANYLTKLAPVDALGPAYEGAAKSAMAAGTDNLPAAPQLIATDPEEAWSQFLPAYQKLENVAGSLSARDLEYAAATAMFGDLNCHTGFFTPRLYDRFVASNRGQATAGLGIIRFPKPPYTILRVLPGTPAEQAGLRAGDRIAAIDHVTPEQVGDQAFPLLSIGDVGQPVVLTLLRPGVADPFDVTVVRQLIQPLIEEHRILPGGVGYIQFNDFTEGSQAVDMVRGALDAFAADGTVNSWLLDLRFNGGGSELTLARLAGLFVPNGSALLARTTQSGRSGGTSSIGTPLPDQKPLVILTSPATASAAEIFTQALHDLGRATVVGSTSDGCVNGGSLFALLDTSGLFISTIDVRSGPNMVPLEGVGVTPDVPVDLTISDLVSGNDPQLAAAVAVLTGDKVPAPATLRAVGQAHAAAGLLWPAATRGDGQVRYIAPAHPGVLVPAGR
ncbi:MAG: S41 family peptidase [Dehalococcoidia bacterium]